MPSIAIIGTEGSGKTVLAAVFAYAYRRFTPGEPCLIPANTTTLKYVEGIFNLLSQGIWPPSTPPGTIQVLQWTLRLPGSSSPVEIPVRLFDVAGQDLRLLFEQEQIGKGDALPGRLKEVAAHCMAAEIVLYLVNLRDLIGHQDASRRAANEAALKAAMDCLGAAGVPRHVCLIFTQSDQYGQEAARAGGWDRLAQKELPYIYSGHLSRIKFAVGAVAAVATTELVDTPNGAPQRVPTKNFQSRGLQSLMRWLANESMLAVAEETAQLKNEAAIRASRAKAAAAKKLAADVRLYGKKPWVWAPAILVLLLLWHGCASHSARQRAQAQRAKSAGQQQMQLLRMLQQHTTPQNLKKHPGELDFGPY